ncbi:MAG: hypothetical protein OXC94_08200 [Chloroflexi bacterium]|nr:hypothetical protein [Chloroflexota bacterium]
MLTDTVDAQVALADFQSQLHRKEKHESEIRVSFRQKGGGTGRRDVFTHWLHSYPAKMFHRIPAVCLDNLHLPQEATILDPFCGSGTVLLEANLRGLDAVGLDINPLALLISRVKVTPVDPHFLTDQLAALLAKAKRYRSAPAPNSVLEYWLLPAARAGLHRLARAIAEVTDPDCRAFFLVTMTSTVRRLSTADPAIPPLVRLSGVRAKSAGARYRRALGHAQSVTTASVYSAFLKAATANIRRMSELHAVQTTLGSTRFADASAHAARTGLDVDSIDAIITSPPYCGAQKYVRSMKLELLLSGFPQSQLRMLDRATLGTEAVTVGAEAVGGLLTGDHYVDSLVREVYDANPVRARMASDYSRYMWDFAEECRRVLRPGGHLFVTLGRSTLAGVPFPADRIFHRAGRKVGLDSIATLIDPIPSRGLLTQRHSTAGRIDHEYIAWLRRPAELG